MQAASVSIIYNLNTDANKLHQSIKNKYLIMKLLYL